MYLFIVIVIAAGCRQVTHPTRRWVGPSALAVSAATASAAEPIVPAPDRFHVPKVCNPHALGSGGKSVAILRNLEG